jgi:PKD repeat protein
VTGPLDVSIAASFTRVLADFSVGLTAIIEGRTSSSTWDFADASAATNLPHTVHAWSTTGDYPVVLTAYNETQPINGSTHSMVRGFAFGS